MGPTSGDIVLRQADLFQRAEDCERALDAVDNPQEKIALRVLRDMWIALANESLGLSEADLAMQVAAIERLYATVAGK